MYLPSIIYELHIETQDCYTYIYIYIYICHIPSSKSSYKVRDHNHFIGEYRGAVHNNCDLKIIYAKYIQFL